ncbi:MAG TPA: ABC transporter ATP-binding protein [Candidatus Tectomicrobia bacterium]|nr:ABC transporter ATP-binding protein [Candidatus Tectomicrobia bacterium]
MPIVEVRDVAKTFHIPTVRRHTLREHALDLFRPRPTERLPVLRSVSFDVAAGETVAIMGRNGCGKTTLLKIVAGIYRPDHGSVTVRAPVTPILELGLGWNPELDAIDNIFLIGSVMGLSLREIRAAVDAILDFAGLERFANQKLQHYSSGMAARLAYAIAFHAVREVLILDEIFAVGDAGFKARCEERYRQLAAAGHTILLVSHNPDLVATFCDRAVLLEDGRVALDDAAKTVADVYVRLLTGEERGGAAWRSE